MPSRPSAAPSRVPALAAVSDRLGGWSRDSAAWRPDVETRGPVGSWVVALLVRAWPWVRWLQLGVIAGGLVTAALTYLAVTTRNRGLAGLSLLMAVTVLAWIVALLAGAVVIYQLRTAASARYTQGNAALARAERATDEERAAALDEAVRALQAAVVICPREVDGDLWAAAHHNLGYALAERADLAANGPERVRLLEQAAAMLWQALDVYSLDGAPAEWAGTLLALGRTLEGQAEAADGEERARLLGAVAAAYGATAEVQTREAAPFAWAGTQATIGATKCKLAALADDGAERARLLELAVDDLRAALEVYTRESYAREWAAAQSLLATTLRGQAALIMEGAERARLLDAAVAALNGAQEVRTRWVAPEEWAALQNELGMTLRERAILAADDDAERVGLLEAAVAALDGALEVRTRERAALAQDAQRARLLEEAGAVYREVLAAYAPDGDVPNAAAYARVRQEMAELA